MHHEDRMCDAVRILLIDPEHILDVVFKKLEIRNRYRILLFSRIGVQADEMQMSDIERIIVRTKDGLVLVNTSTRPSLVRTIIRSI